MNLQFRDALRKVLGDLTDKQIQYRALEIDGRSVAEVTLHAVGMFTGLTAVVAGEPWPEPPSAPSTVTEQLDWVEAEHHRTAGLLHELSERALDQPVTLPWGADLLGRDAIVAGLAHGLVHAGNIAGIRAIGGFPTPPEGS